MAQRWRLGRDSYRKPDEPIRTEEYDIGSITDDTAAKSFVVRHHYSGSYPAARYRMGLFRHGVLCGVAVFSHPVNNLTITKTLGIADYRDGVELGRFVLLNEVPANGESWFLSRCFKLLKKDGLAGVVSFSDPCKRMSQAGVEVFGGHIGTIYQALNAHYLGRSKARTLKLLPDGSVLAPRTMQKIRSAEKGVEYAVKALVIAGACEPASWTSCSLREWLAEWLPKISRNLRHRGCHKYAWSLSLQTCLPRSLPYPKQKDES